MRTLPKRTSGVCLKCNCVVTADDIVVGIEEFTAHGIKFHANQKHAHCAICGAEVYVSDINDYNAEQRENAYKNVLRLEKGGINSGHQE